MPVILGGPTALRVKRKGDIVISFQHINGEEAMCLYPAIKKAGSGSYVVCLSAAHKYVEPEYLAQAAVTAAKVMGFEPDRSLLFRIKDIIIENLEDLIRMTPEPLELEMAGHKVAEVDLRMDGDLVSTKEVMVPKIFGMRH